MPEPKIMNKQMIEELYDGAATSYDRIGPSIFAWFGRSLAEKIPLVSGARVLDIATGKGAVLLPAALRVGQEGCVAGIDLSDAILQEAEHAVRANSLTNVELRKMDAEHLEFPDQSFDIVTCAFSIFFFPNMKAALREMYRVCKPDGCVAMTNFNKVPFPFSPGLPVLRQQFPAYGVGIQPPQPLAYTSQEIEAMLSPCGFRSIETQSEESDIVFGSGEDLWAFFMTLGSRLSILSMSEETRARFKDEYFAKLRPMFRQDGLHMSVGVVYTLAKR